MTVSVGDDLRTRVRRLEADLANLLRRRGITQPNLRDLADAALTGVADGQVPVYDAATGLWVPGVGGGDIPPFSMGGVLESAESARWYPPRNLTLGRMLCSLRVAGSSTTTVTLKKNGSTADTVTLVASDNLEGKDISVDLLGPETDYITMSVSPGTNAAWLTVQLSEA